MVFMSLSSFSDPNDRKNLKGADQRVTSDLQLKSSKGKNCMSQLEKGALIHGFQNQSQNIKETQWKKFEKKQQPTMKLKPNVQSLEEKAQKLLYMLKKTQSSIFADKPLKDQMIKLLTTLFNLKQQISPTVKLSLFQILDYIKIKIQKLPYSYNICQQLLQITQKVERKYEYVGSKRNAEVQDNSTDKGYQHFLQELETKPRRQAVYYLESDKEPNRKISLGEFMAEKEEYHRDGHWKDLLFMAEYFIEEFNLQHEDRMCHQILKLLKKREFDSSVQQQAVGMDISCLGCVPYFVMNWNFYDQHLTKTKMVLLPKAIDLLNKKDKQTVLDNLYQKVEKLISGQGGVILFDCERFYLNVVARGEFFGEQERKEVQTDIEGYLQQRWKESHQTPLSQNVVVSFVPVAKDPLKKIDQKQPQKKTELMENLFVLRVTVRPRSIESSGWVATLLRKLYSCFDHSQCKAPLQVSSQKKMTENINEEKDPEVRFKYASAMVVKKDNIEIVNRKLRKYGFNFQLVHPFGHHNLKGAGATAILYHNDPFIDILTAISYNKEFCIDDRQVIVVAITEMIKLADRSGRRMLPKADLDALQNWATNEFKGKKLKVSMFKYSNEQGETEIYIRTGHHACNLLMYLVLNHHNQKAILRNPKQPKKAQLLL